MQKKSGFPCLEWLLLFVIPAIVCGSFFGTGLTLQANKSTDPSEFERQVSHLLGVREEVAYSIDGDTKAIAEANNLNEEAFANAIIAHLWVKEYFDVEVSIGILYAIDLAEWRGGEFPGDCNGIDASMGNSNVSASAQQKAALEILDHWKEYKVRHKQIFPDWTGYWGGCSTGEIGSGFIPETALRVLKAIAATGDPDVQDWNLWDHTTTLKATAYEVGRMCPDGVNEDCLFGWNQNAEYRGRLVRAANKLDAKLGGGLTATVQSGRQLNDIGKLRKQLVLAYLEFWGLEKPKSVRATYAGGKALWVLYGHMSKIDVAETQDVKQGETLGLCGSTGESTGGHVHLEIADVNPRSIPYLQQGTETQPGKMDPLTILGTEGLLDLPFDKSHLVIDGRYPEGISQYFMDDRNDQPNHPGTDFPCVPGVPLLALADGVIEHIDANEFDSSGYGMYVVLRIPVSEAIVASTTINADGFANPYPTATDINCGPEYGQAVGEGVHWGLDMCGGSDWIYSMHGGKVVYADFLDRNTQQAFDWWLSGNTVAIEGTDKNGDTIWSVYGHGADGTMQVAVGQDIEAGTPLFRAGDTGYANNTIHLHLGFKKNGSWSNPLPLIYDLSSGTSSSSLYTDDQDYENYDFLVPTPMP